ncbi:MAG: DUF309 domain-containing protein [Deltaproteobacteria bacterium]|nr:MAG: DUF309 domain-containing protein [Deltaproteobacteria bacterium]
MIPTSPPQKNRRGIKPVGKTLEGSPPRLFLDAVERFNGGAFFEAHELWEDLWRASSGFPRDLLQGLVQISAGFVHAQRGNRKGALSLCAKGLGRLAPYPPSFWQIDLDTFRREVAQWRETFLLSSGAEESEISFPTILCV